MVDRVQLSRSKGWKLPTGGRYRDKLRGGPPRELKPCGSRAARVRHKRNDEDCAVCWPNRPKDRDAE